MTSRCGRWVWSLGGTLNYDQWSGLLTDIPTLFSYLFQLHHGQSSTLHIPHFIFFLKMFFVTYIYIYSVNTHTHIHTHTHTYTHIHTHTHIYTHTHTHTHTHRRPQAVVYTACRTSETETAYSCRQGYLGSHVLFPSAQYEGRCSKL